MLTLQPSRQPERALLQLAYPGQDPLKRQYKAGFEDFFALLPIIQAGEYLQAQVEMTAAIIKQLAKSLYWAPWLAGVKIEPGKFERYILGLEEPVGGKEGVELVVAKWGTGYTSPVHGHASGYMHEEVLFGKLRVDTYQLTEEGTVVPMGTEIVTRGTFVSKYHESIPGGPARPHLIHSFTALEPSATLHYLPEHVRDNRDNGFVVERFNNGDWLVDVEQITAEQGMYLQVGDVVAVRSTNVPQYDDHYLVVTGPPVMKEHGMRVQEVAMWAPDTSRLLNRYMPKLGVTLLKLNPKAKRLFHRFHNIAGIQDGQIIHSKPLTTCLGIS